MRRSFRGLLFRHIPQGDDQQHDETCNHRGLACVGESADDDLTGVVLAVGAAGKTEVVRERRADDHAEHGHGAVAVALRRQNELTKRAAAEEHAAPADEHHAEQVPDVGAVGDGLKREAEAELIQGEVADDRYDEDSREAIE